MKQEMIMDTQPPKESNGQLADIAVSTLELLLALRNQCSYRGRAWRKLNNACCWVNDSFWQEAEHA